MKLGPTVSLWVMLLLVSLPLFFAGIIFGSSFKNVSDTDLAFGSNLLGAITGGFLEYSSLAWGFNFLLVLALILYLFSFIAGVRHFK
jgi:multisubunit Na+/H+ antiporter MnhF subunit